MSEKFIGLNVEQAKSLCAKLRLEYVEEFYVDVKSHGSSAFLCIRADLSNGETAKLLFGDFAL